MRIYIAAPLLAAMLFWWVLLKPTGAARLRYGMAIPYLFTTALQGGVLGALMTFTTQPWYPTYQPLVYNISILHIIFASPERLACQKSSRPFVRS